MQRAGQLWEQVTAFENLYLAYRKAIRGKRRRPDVARFIVHAETELWTLHEELRTQTYQPGAYRTFYVYDRKPRLISAAPFRDRVVHHALCNVLEPLFERVFIPDLYSNRPGKGQHQAVKQAQQFAREFPYVLKCDIKKYFPTIDHALLKQELRRKIKCPATLALVDLLIDRSNPQPRVDDYFPGDTLLTPAERRKGLPIGNQTSQFWANVYLNPLDHFVKRTLRVRGYLRYVDDFFLFGESKAQLWAWRDALAEFLETYRLRLKPNGVTLFRVRDGFPCLGYRVFPEIVLINRRAILRFRRRMPRVRALRRAGRLRLDQVKCAVFGAMGHFAQATTAHLRAQLLAEAWF